MLSYLQPVVGTLAGEVANPRRDFPRALWILIPIVFFITMIPLALGISMDQNIDKWVTVVILVELLKALKSAVRANVSGDKRIIDLG